MTLARTVVLYARVASTPGSAVRWMTLLYGGLIGGMAVVVPSRDGLGLLYAVSLAVVLGQGVTPALEGPRVSRLAWPGLPVSTRTRAVAAGILTALLWLVSVGVATAIRIVLDGVVPGLVPTSREILTLAATGGLWAGLGAVHSVLVTAVLPAVPGRGLVSVVPSLAFAGALMMSATRPEAAPVAAVVVGVAVLLVTLANPWPALVAGGRPWTSPEPAIGGRFRPESGAARIARLLLERVRSYRWMWAVVAMGAGLYGLLPIPVLLAPLCAAIGLVVTALGATLGPGGRPATPYTWLPAHPDAVFAGHWLAGMALSAVTLAASLLLQRGATALGISLFDGNVWGLALATERLGGDAALAAAVLTPDPLTFALASLAASAAAASLFARGGPGRAAEIGLADRGFGRAFTVAVLVAALVGPYALLPFGAGLRWYRELGPDADPAALRAALTTARLVCLGLLVGAVVPALPRLRRGLLRP